VWIVNFEDGTSKSSKNCHWTDLPKDKRVTGLQLSHPMMPKLFLCITDLNQYYFVTEAIALPFQKQGAVQAEIIGGHDTKLKVGIEVRMENTGNIEIKHYPMESFKYSKDILRDGKFWGPRPPREAPAVIEPPVAAQDFSA
jgi:hypothetical protein